MSDSKIHSLPPPYYPTNNAVYAVHSHEEDTSSKIAKAVVVIFFLMAGTAAITCGLLFSLKPLWATGIALAASTFMLTFLCCCCCAEDDNQHIVYTPPSRLNHSLSTATHHLSTSFEDSTPSLQENPEGIACSLAVLKQMNGRDLAINHGKDLLKIYRLYSKQREQLRPIDSKIYTSLITHWDLIPNNTDEKIGFIYTRISEDCAELSEVDLKSKLIGFIYLLEVCKCDFSELFENLFKYALPLDHVLKKHLPLSYLEHAVTNAQLKAMFSTETSAIGILTYIAKSLTCKQNIRLTNFFLSKECNLSPQTKETCLDLLRNLA